MKFKIDDWHENGNNIWFYIKGHRSNFKVPQEIIYKVQMKAVNNFKKKVKELFE